MIVLRPARLGLRIARACAAHLAAGGIDATIIDPLDLDLPTPFKPHFAYASGRAPEVLDALARQIADADGYVMVSPEYNHAMSPALADLLNHYGNSLYSFKPSAIVTYSAGQWGGTRAAVNMRTFLSELGCLPVSAMVHIPHAQDVLSEDGTYAEGVDSDRWAGYLDRCLQQLAWWAEAAEKQRATSETTEAFNRDPSQRDAP
ncbi:NADPH-dependent FMN reductase [Sulfitobacter sp. JB4-11]|uniref:NADPH-dependent FMN reductase n=1 Tax=Sulfitobacter rhodophyticola TaxID=3238304 RepID=UPI00351867B8